MKRATLIVLVGLMLAAGVRAQTTRYVGGPNPFTDSNGKLWSPIPLSILTGGNRWSTCAPTWPNGGLFQQQLVFTGTTGIITVPVPQGTYTVNLYFGEPCATETAGQRVFSVSVNGVVLDAAMDMVKEAGGAQKPLIKTTTITSTSVVVSFSTQNAATSTIVIAGVEVLPAGPVVTSVKYAQTVNGTGFVQGSVVSEGGTACPTQFVSSTQLTSQCPVGTGTITVSNPHQVTLNWTPGATDATHGAATSYIVLKAPNATGTYAQIATPTAPPYVDKNVSPGEVPCYKTQGVNQDGTSAATSPVCAAMP